MPLWSMKARTADGASSALAGAEALIGLAQTQLLVQMLDSDNADGRSMGLLGLDGALTAADLAAKDILGGRWWLPLPGLALSAAILLGLRRGLHLELGPSPRGFFSLYGGQPGDGSRVLLLSDLDDALRKNVRMLARKERRLAVAIWVLVLTIAYSTAAFAG
jgi:hypothetical protein